MVFGDNYFQPLRLTDIDLKKIYDKSDFKNINYSTFKRQYNSLYIKLSNLPLLDLEDIELSQKEQEAISILENPSAFVREQKTKGGLVSGPEVTDTKEDPADRVDPFTGLPYSEQMDRLGFNKGVCLKIDYQSLT